MKKFDILGEIWQMSDYYLKRHEESRNGDYPFGRAGLYIGIRISCVPQNGRHGCKAGQNSFHFNKYDDNYG